MFLIVLEVLWGFGDDLGLYMVKGMAGEGGVLKIIFVKSERLFCKG